MFIIAGLGNPGKEYAGTRHNIGFETIDYIAQKAGIDVIEKKHKAIIGKGYIDGEKVILAKPQTYMNLSGESLRELVDYYKCDHETEVIVIHDDIALDAGNLRIRKKGSAGSHNGLKSIINHFGNDTFVRIKMGVGDKRGNGDLAKYVLGHFDAADREKLEETKASAYEAVKLIMAGDVDKAMNLYNKKNTEQK
ncbi:MAG: aminoacyl-tRNA hydrolase [Acetatifactor sp.]|nr:aminoacyl-tRNA hydrolase [Acetatifactor sp.]